MIENYIITNLTVLGGFGLGFPCGANDNNNIRVFSLIENNVFCSGKYNTSKYYFFKNLSTITLKQFYEENNIDLSDLPEYNNLTKLGDMTLFSTGYFSLDEEDIKNFGNSPSGFEKNNKYSIIMGRCSFICFVTSFVLGGYGFIFLFFGYDMGNTLAKIIFISISLLINLLICICSLIEIIMGNKIFEIKGYIPRFIFSEIKEMKSSSGHAHFWPFFGFIIIQIPFYIVLICKYKKEKNPYNKTPLIEKDPLFKEPTQLTPINVSTSCQNNSNYNCESQPQDTPF